MLDMVSHVYSYTYFIRSRGRVAVYGGEDGQWQHHRVPVGGRVQRKDNQHQQQRRYTQ